MQTQAMFELGNAEMHAIFQLDNRAIVEMGNTEMQAGLN